MRVRPGGVLSLPWLRAGYATKSPPPLPRPYRPLAPSERLPERPPEEPEPSPPPKKRKQSFVHRLFSQRDDPPAESIKNEPSDIARGWQATQRVVREGVLDPRYKQASRKITAIIVGLPLVIVLGIELYRRRFMGKEAKGFSGKQSGTEGESAPS